MKIYAAGERQAQGRHPFNINPAAHLSDRTACPGDWFDDDGNPREFVVQFVDGEAEVDDRIGRYMVAHRMARKTKLIIPAGVLV